MPPSPSKQPVSLLEHDPYAEIIAKFAPTFNRQPTEKDLVETVAGTAVFGQSMWLTDAWDPRSDPSRPSMRLFQERIRLVQPSANSLGCRDAQYPSNRPNFIAFVKRGKCTFYEKLLTAKRYGALGVVVWGSEQDGNQLIRPSADGEMLQEVEDVGMVYITGEVGRHLAERMDRGEDISVSFTSVDVDFEDLDIASITLLLERKQKDIDIILETLETAKYDYWWDQLLDGDMEGLAAARAMEDRLQSPSTSETDKALADERAADAFDVALERRPPSVIPAGVMVLGLPIANLFIMTT